MNTPRQYTRTRQYFFKKRNNRLFTNIRDGKKYERIQNNGCRIGDQMPQLAFHNRYISSRTPQNYQNRQYLYWAQLADWFSPENSAFCAGVPPEAGAGAGASRGRISEGNRVCLSITRRRFLSPMGGPLTGMSLFKDINFEVSESFSSSDARTSAHPKRKIFSPYSPHAVKIMVSRMKLELQKLVIDRNRSCNHGTSPMFSGSLLSYLPHYHWQKLLFDYLCTVTKRFQSSEQLSILVYGLILDLVDHVLIGHWDFLLLNHGRQCRMGSHIFDVDAVNVLADSNGPAPVVWAGATEQMGV